MVDASKSDVDIVVTADALMWLTVRAYVALSLRDPRVHTAEARAMAVQFVRAIDTRLSEVGIVNADEVHESCAGIPELLGH